MVQGFAEAARILGGHPFHFQFQANFSAKIPTSKKQKAIDTRATHPLQIAGTLPLREEAGKRIVWRAEPTGVTLTI
jgi:hypothetical protein